MRLPRIHVHYTHEALNCHPCPTCKAKLCNATNVEAGDPTGPEPGHTVLCIECGHASVFTPTMQLRTMRAEELAEASREPVFARAYAAALPTRRRHAGNGGD